MRIHPPFLPILGFLLLSAPALAGDVYHRTVTQQGGAGALAMGEPSAPVNSTAKILVDGKKYRVELERAAPTHQVVISKDGGEHETALNLENHTFFPIKTDASKPTSLLFGLLPLPYAKRSVSHVAFDTVDATAPETVAGASVRRHEIRLSYDITIVMGTPPGVPVSPRSRPETIRGKVKVEAIYWMTEGKAPDAPRLFRPEMRTGFPEIDTRLAAAFTALPGMAIKQQVTISTEGDQGTMPRTSIHTEVLEHLGTQEMKASLFEVPGGFKMHEPEMSMPGLRMVPPG
jgi:hypothetical protein